MPVHATAILIALPVSMIILAIVSLVHNALVGGSPEQVAPTEQPQQPQQPQQQPKADVEAGAARTASADGSVESTLQPVVPGGPTPVAASDPEPELPPAAPAALIPQPGAEVPAAASPGGALPPIRAPGKLDPLPAPSGARDPSPSKLPPLEPLPPS